MEIPSESIIEEDEEDQKKPLAFNLFKRKTAEPAVPDHKTISVNLLKNFD